MLSIAHLSSAHQRNDTRIFLKMCISLSKNNYKVHLVVADGLGNAKKKGVFIHDVGSTKMISRANSPKNWLLNLLF